MCERICVVCKKSFIYKTYNQKVCSPECREVLTKEREAKYRFKKRKKISKYLKEYFKDYERDKTKVSNYNKEYYIKNKEEIMKKRRERKLCLS